MDLCLDRVLYCLLKSQLLNVTTRFLLIQCHLNIQTLERHTGKFWHNGVFVQMVILPGVISTNLTARSFLQSMFSHPKQLTRGSRDGLNSELSLNLTVVSVIFFQSPAFFIPPLLLFIYLFFLFSGISQYTFGERFQLMFAPLRLLVPRPVLGSSDATCSKAASSTIFPCRCRVA